MKKNIRGSDEEVVIDQLREEFTLSSFIDANLEVINEPKLTPKQ